MNREPVMLMVGGLVSAAIALLVAFGVNITDAQGAAIGGFVAAAIGVAIWVRSRVTPTPKQKDDAGLTLVEVLVVLLIILVVLFLVGAVR